MAVLKAEMLLALMTIPVESPYSSSIAEPTRPTVAFWPLIVEFSIVTPLVWVKAMPKSPPAATWTSLTVTLEALMSSSWGMYRPLRTAPFPVTITSPPVVL